MAITASGIYFLTFEHALINTLAIDWELDTHKMAIFTDTVAPNFQTDTAYGVAPYNANEVANSTGWPTGGVALAGTALTAADPAKYDATDYSQADTTFTNGMGGLVYADALAGNEALFLVDFVTAVSPSAGTFTITWDAAGVVTFDLEP